MLFEEKHSKSNYCCRLAYEDLFCLMHCQTSFELLFVKSGSVRLELQNRTLTVEEGECVWILPYEIHRFTTPQKSSVFILIFSPDHVADFYDAVRCKTLTLPVLKFTPEVLDALQNETTDPFRLKSALYRLCSDVLSNGAAPRADSSETDNSVKIMLYIQEHYKEPITLKELARDLGYSYSHTSAIFGSCFEKSFSETVNEYRLNEAVRLIQDGNHTITEISQLCGFSTIRNFNIAFKNYYGKTPKEFHEF